MNLAEYKGVYVFAQQVDNQISSIALELIGKGKDLAKDLGTTVTAVLVGSNVKGLADELGEYGADKVIVVDDPELKDYRTEPYTHAITSVINEFKPDIFLIGATAIGRDLGPRVSARVQTGLTADCTAVDYDEETGTYHLKADELIGTEIYLDFASVGATINIMLAAVKAKGRTVIENAAKEPEIIDVANLLTKMGARIRGVGTDTITIDGVEHMHGAYHEIIPDRIEAGTFLIIAAAIGEKMVIQNIIPQHLDALISKLKEMGIKMEKIGDSIVVYGNDGNLKPVEVQTQVYPGFATDLQQPLTTLLTQGNGQSKVSETIYKERFKHCAQLNKMGADIELGEACAYIKGKTPLHGARVMATDLRCGAALVVAGLMAEGKTEITNVYHIDRGYDNIDHKLITLGAHITRYMIDD